MFHINVHYLCGIHLFPSVDRQKFQICHLSVICLLFTRYESTSSEDEEDEEEEEEEEGEEEVDGSSSAESGDGDSSEDEAALDEETSEEERNINLDESDTDEEALRAANYCSDDVKEKYVSFYNYISLI